jgi:hypothetical protein
VCSTAIDAEEGPAYTKELIVKEYMFYIGSDLLLPGMPTLAADLILLQGMSCIVDIVFTHSIPKKLDQLGVITDNNCRQVPRYFYKPSKYVNGEALAMYELTLNCVVYYNGDLQYLSAVKKEL